MQPEKKGTSVDRRSLLRSIGGAGVTGAAVVAGTAVPVEARENDKERRKARYRETEHVKAYYRTNRY